MRPPAAEPVRPAMLLLGLGLALGVGAAALSLPFEDPSQAAVGASAVGVTTFVVTAWLTRSMPLGAASLLPLVLFPLFGVLSTAAVAGAYAHPILWLFFGGFILALAIERWGLHRRLSIQVLAMVGPHPRRLVLGFLATGLLMSMWISNTAASLMLLPIGWALVDRIARDGLLTPAAAKNFGTATMLAIGYGCSVGGVATPIGTAPNALFFSNWRFFHEQEAAAGAAAPTMSFLLWTMVFAPFAILLGLTIWWLLTRVVHRIPGGAMGAGDLVEEARNLPRMEPVQRRVLALFGLAVVLWLTRGDVQLGDSVVRGWASRLFPGGSGFVLDGSVAVGVAILAFLVSAGTADGRRIMDWQGTRELPYDILYLLGGGIAIAGAFAETGVSGAMGNLLAPLIGGAHPFLVVLVLCLLITFLTEVSSNTAITSVFLPVLLAGALSADLDPRLLMLPATIAASCAFMFPIATPPNAVVFSSGHITFGEMARAGLLINFVSVALLAGYLWFVGFPLLGVEVDGGLPWR